MRKNFKITNAMALTNGIVYFYKNYAALTTIDKGGNIYTAWITKKDFNFLYDNDYLTDSTYEAKKIDKTYIIFPFLTVLTIIVSSLIAYYNIIYGIRTLFFSLCIITIFEFLTTASTFTSGELRFHSAEHMVINAFSKLKRIPTLKEIHKFSRFSKYCGSNETIFKILIYISIVGSSFVLNIYENLMAFLLLSFVYFAIIFAIIIVLWQSDHLNFMQEFTTLPPTDKELKVAIAGASYFIEQVSRFENSNISKPKKHRKFSLKKSFK